MVGGVLEQDALAGHALRRQPAFPSTLGHRLPTTRTVSWAEALLVEQMGHHMRFSPLFFLGTCDA